jgi:cobalt-zinc-cadmium efflux system membrane fusion protein
MKRMKIRIPQVVQEWFWPAILVVGCVAGSMTRDKWYPPVTDWVHSMVARFRTGEVPAGTAAATEENSPAGHAAHDAGTSLELSDQALRNIGLSSHSIRPIELQTFRRSITVPAVVVERPGRTLVQVATPMTGVITHVHAVQGEAVQPGTLLFQIRLTHEDLVQAQTNFLQALGEFDVEEREITRLRGVTRSGAVAGKVMLERQYARDKLMALLRAQREALRLHGLSDEQVEGITNNRRLLRELQIFAPSIDTHDNELNLSRRVVQPVAFRQDGRRPQQQLHTGPLILQKLNLHKGQSVKAGETLAMLADYDELFIEGMAFEQDIPQLRKLSQRDWKVTAIFGRPDSTSKQVDQLEIAFLANEVDARSRTLHFYVRLPNEITTDRRVNGKGYVEWKYLPGQRLQLRVPVEEWPDQIVLPVEAVAREGAEYFAFQQNGKHFDRVPVHVKYRDQYSVVIDNDGSLFPGDIVATLGAHQMQMALKNKAGGGVDPHAGHSH